MGAAGGAPARNPPGSPRDASGPAPGRTVTTTSGPSEAEQRNALLGRIRAGVLEQGIKDGVADGPWEVVQSVPDVANRAARPMTSLLPPQISAPKALFSGDVLVMTHTYVPPPLEGRGIAGHGRLDHTGEAVGRAVAGGEVVAQDHPRPAADRIHLDRLPPKRRERKSARPSASSEPPNP